MSTNQVTESVVHPTSQRARVCSLTHDSLQLYDIVYVRFAQVKAFRGITGLSMLKSEPLNEGDPIIFNDPLHWWELHSLSFPLLAKVGCRVLVIPARSAKSKQIFSVAGQTGIKKRACLSIDNVELLVFFGRCGLHAWAAKKQKRAKGNILASSSVSTTR